MVWLLQRKPRTEAGTAGILATPLSWSCYTLEPTTPIPAGQYQVALTTSERAARGRLWTPRNDFKLYELQDVPGHTAIRIHAGNCAHDTDGCILVGTEWDGSVLRWSRAALQALMTPPCEPLAIRILNP